MRGAKRFLRVILGQAAAAAILAAGEAILQAPVPEPLRSILQVSIGAAMNAAAKELREWAKREGHTAPAITRVF